MDTVCSVCDESSGAWFEKQTLFMESRTNAMCLSSSIVLASGRC